MLSRSPVSLFNILCSLYPEPAEEQRRRNLEAEYGGPSKQRPQGKAEGPRYETTAGALPDHPDTIGPHPVHAGSELDVAPTTPFNSRPMADNGQLPQHAQRVGVHRIPTEPQDLNIPEEVSAASETSSSTWSDHSTHGEGGAAGTAQVPLGGTTTDVDVRADGPTRVRPRPGFTCNADGSRMPLGPQCEFKIIDYGSSFFSETLAQATGGFRARDNYDRLRRLFESKQVAFRSPTRQTLIEVNTTVGQPVETSARGDDYRWHLIPTGIKHRVS